MKIKQWMFPTACMLMAFAIAPAAFPQAPPPLPGPPGAMGEMHVQGKNVLIHREMGKWWRSSEVAKKLQLSDSQIAELDKTFYDHRLKLIDYGAEMEKEDLKLQNLLDADVPNEGQVGSQVDQVLAARGKLEREYTMMNLDLRKVLSVEQWRQLKSIRNERDPGDHVFFYKKLPPGSGPGMPPPPLGPGGDDLF
jgi:Spy/CpxP family protein refolding chaperone